MKVRSKSGEIYEVCKYTLDVEGNENIWCKTWKGHHVIGQDCDFVDALPGDRFVSMEQAKKLALRFSAYWGSLTVEDLSYYIVEKDNSQNPIPQYYTREEMFDKWIKALPI